MPTGVKTDAFVIHVNSDGSRGYHSVYHVLKDSPYQKIADLKAAIRAAYLDAPIKVPAAFNRLSGGKNQPWQLVDNAADDHTIKLIQFVGALRKRTG